MNVINSISHLLEMKKLAIKKTSKLALLLPLAIAFAGVSTKAVGGEYSEKEIKLEISYLAKKLLDMSGKDSYEISSEAYMRPFIGICSEVTEAGLKLTCVTPGTQAEKNGLKTGDVVLQMNDVDLRGSDLSRSKTAWWTIAEKMKIGDVIKMKVQRGTETLTREVTVGSNSHPAFTLKVKK